MTIRETRSSLSFALAAAFVLGAFAINPTMVRPASAGDTYDLAGDWSDTSNPNATWSYNDGTGNAIETQQSDWCPGCFDGGTVQPAWAHESIPDFGHIPTWFKTVRIAAPPHDFPVGRVVMHTPDGANASVDAPADVTWTSPIDGVVEISGGVWLARKAEGRSVVWKIKVNDVTITEGNLTSVDPFDSTNPFDLAAGSGGASALTLDVSVGDIVALELGRISLFGEFVGIDMTITEIDTFIEEEIRELAVTIRALDLGLFSGPNDKANKGQRKSLANRVTKAADALALGDIAGAIDSLDSLLDRIDGQTPPPDWMENSPEQEALAIAVEELIDDLLLEL